MSVKLWSTILIQVKAHGQVKTHPNLLKISLFSFYNLTFGLKPTHPTFTHGPIKGPLALIWKNTVHVTAYFFVTALKYNLMKWWHIHFIQYVFIITCTCQMPFILGEDVMLICRYVTLINLDIGLSVPLSYFSGAQHIHMNVTCQSHDFLLVTGSIMCHMTVSPGNIVTWHVTWQFGHMLHFLVTGHMVVTSGRTITCHMSVTWQQSWFHPL